MVGGADRLRKPAGAVTHAVGRELDNRTSRKTGCVTPGYGERS